MLRIDNLWLKAGDFLLGEVSLEVGANEYFVLMGPTGSGKSLLARCICGLVRPAGGHVGIGGRDVTDLEPRRRTVGYMPQDCILFPHMDVARNITFPCRVRGERHAAALKNVASIIDMLGLGPLLDRRPETLSGGERQKVALARALAVRPSLLLLDEPLSALDEPTRRHVSAEFLPVLRGLTLTTVHICHNLEEAETLADRIGVMHQGKLIQTGRIDELRRNPANETVSRLVGAGQGDSPADGKATAGGLSTCSSDGG